MGADPSSETEGKKKTNDENEERDRIDDLPKIPVSIPCREKHLTQLGSGHGEVVCAEEYPANAYDEQCIKMLQQIPDGVVCIPDG